MGYCSIYNKGIPKIQILLYCLLFIPYLEAQELRIEPPNWWVDMDDSRVQIMVHAPGIGEFDVQFEDDDATLIKVHKADSPNYLFLDLELEKGMTSKTLELNFHATDGRNLSVSYPILSRQNSPESLTGFDISDVIYLITPDRFANGDPSNDRFEILNETDVDRTDDYARHGGDIAGITAHLDYIADMGFTALWSSPLLINDMPEQSYHGYAITDYYRVDPRFGSLEEYKALAGKAREKGIKLIMDQVANHCGLEHWWMTDLPFDDWINDQANFSEGKPIVQTHHRRTTNQDIYASKEDKERMRKGWFVPAMPDLNQENPFLAQYIIQNSIWWIETLQLGGIRQDTYPYPEKEFMARWAQRIMTEYPNFNIVGEEWSYNPLRIAYWQNGTRNADGYRSFLKTPMDFPLHKALIQSLREEEDWNSGWNVLYEALANDFTYANPSSLLLFPDNHDMDRVHFQLGEDFAKTKMALAFTLIAPRIPQLYYGTEILMSNAEMPGSHGRIRTDFPGGWKEDEVNAFTGVGLTVEQKEMQDWLKSLLRFRKENAVLHQGKTRHFSPDQGVYVIFRYTPEQAVMLILNKNREPYTLDLTRFQEMGIIGKQATDIIEKRTFELSDTLVLKGHGPRIVSINTLGNE